MALKSILNNNYKYPTLLKRCVRVSWGRKLQKSQTARLVAWFTPFIVATSFSFVYAVVSRADV